MKKFLLIAFALLITTSGVVLLQSHGVLAATAKEEICSGIGGVSGGGGCASDNSLNNVVSNIIDVFSVVVGIAAVFMLILGGFKYITSGGDTAKVSSAKNTIVYAVIGLVIVALAQAIVGFVLSKVA